MSERDDGGQAFPGQIETGAVYVDPVLGKNFAEYAPAPGMSLRDYFAGIAMQAILANPSAQRLNNQPVTEDFQVATASYSMADLMLKVRKQ